MRRPLVVVLSLLPFWMAAQSPTLILGEVTHRTASVTVAVKAPEHDYYNHLGWFAVGPNNEHHPLMVGEISKYFDDLKPGTVYRVAHITPTSNASEFDTNYVTEFATLEDWQHRREAPDFSFVTGSCSYINEEPTDRPGDPYGGGYGIYGHMVAEDADFNLWLGDNLYLRPSDYTSTSGIMRRYFYSRRNESLSPLLSSRPNLAIWDDHDAGPNNCIGTFSLIDETREAFRIYWPRESYGTPEVEDLRWVSAFSDVVVIGLDNRSHRTSEHAPNPQILGKEQIDWLVSQVRFYRSASFIVVAIGGQVLNSAAVYENYAQYPEERNYLLSQLASTGYDNLVFFTGDRHHSERSELELDGHRIVDFTVSPMTSGPSTVVGDEVNANRVGDYIDERNYAVVSVTGEHGERKMTVIYKNSEGEEISRHTIDSL